MSAGGESRSDLASLADANFVVHAAWLQRQTAGMFASGDDEDVVVVDSGLPCDTFNLICRSRLSEATAPERIRGALARFRASGRPFSWWVGPGDSPANLGSLLEEEGLHAAESEVAMAAHLATMPNGDPPPALEIRRVASRDELMDFAAVNAANWSPPDPYVLEFYARVADAALRADSPLRFYVGYADGVAVATAELTVTGPVVGLYNIATLAAFRRRGFGSAMTAWPLREARREGATIAVLQASADGAGIYRRAGFEAFGEIKEYKDGSR